MARPTKIELLQRFFPELLEKRGTKGDREAALRVNTAACTAILADLLNLYDKGLASLGLGVLCMRLQAGGHESSYLTLEDFRADREQAAREQRTELGDFLASVIDEIERTSPEKAALILLLDNTSAQLFPIGRDDPGRSIQALMEEFSA